MFRLLFFVACVLSFSCAFLLDSVTSLSPTVGHVITDDHYETLFRLFLGEKENRRQLQQYVLGLEAKFDKLAKQCNTLHVMKPDNATKELEAKYQYLTLTFVSMKSNLEHELATYQNRTAKLEQEVTNLKTVKCIDQLQPLNNVQKQVQTLQADVQSLVVSNQARSQDLMSVYNDMNSSKQRIIELEHNTQSLEKSQILIMDNITIMDNEYKQQIIGFQINTQSLINKQSTIWANMTNIGNNQNFLKAQIDSVTQQIQDKEQYVAFTAVGRDMGAKRSSGYKLHFPDIISSAGISNLSSMRKNGTFICEKSGLYLISVTVMVCTTDSSAFLIHKNHQDLMYYFIGRSDGKARNCNSGTGTTVVQLDVNDAINVRNTDDGVELYENWSSFSAVKIN